MVNDTTDIEFVETRSDPPNTTPLPHDGWRSRKMIVGCIAALLVFVAASIMAVWSGHYSAQQWFVADYWVKSVWVSATILAFAFGLLTAEKALELIKIIVPALGLILRDRGK